MSPTLISRDQLRDVLSYCPDSGEFSWIRSRSGQKASVGCIKAGYLVIRLRGRVYRAHRLAWLYMHGQWPKNQIDHLDGNKLNNRLANLRDVTAAENSQNHCAVGVHKRGCRWRAIIGANRRQRALGTFDTREEARLAYLEARRMIHPGFVPFRAGMAEQADAADSKSAG
jgi:hypothetical protein